MGNLLLFGSLGWAYLGLTLPGLFRRSDKWLNGYVFGLGAEYSITRNVSIHAEFSHYDFGNTAYNVPSGPAAVGTSENLLTFGVSAHF